MPMTYSTVLQYVVVTLICSNFFVYFDSVSTEMGKTRFQYQLNKASGSLSDTEKKSRTTYSDKEKRRQVDCYLEAKEKDQTLSMDLFAAKINVPRPTFRRWLTRWEALPFRCTVTVLLIKKTCLSLFVETDQPDRLYQEWKEQQDFHRWKLICIVGFWRNVS